MKKQSYVQRCTLNEEQQARLDRIFDRVEFACAWTVLLLMAAATVKGCFGG